MYTIFYVIVDRMCMKLCEMWTETRKVPQFSKVTIDSTSDEYIQWRTYAISDRYSELHCEDLATP